MWGPYSSHCLVYLIVIVIAVLGSSGECLPVNRPTTFLAGKREILNSCEAPRAPVSNNDSMFSSAHSEDDDEVFHSARTSIDMDSDDSRRDGENFFSIRNSNAT